jgi:hypothetical protein
MQWQRRVAGAVAGHSPIVNRRVRVRHYRPTPRAFEKEI